MTIYYTVAETAKLVRRALKESFPSVNFSVRSKSYAGGASIDVSWIDGPASTLVDMIAKQFEGSYFDGMTDYKGSNTHMMDGQRVSFGADFVFTAREYSDALIQRVINSLCAKWQDGPAPTVEQYRKGQLWSKWFDRYCVNSQSFDMQSMIRGQAAKRSTVVAPLPSELMRKVFFLEDDGYGYGSVGKSARLTVVQGGAI